MWGLESLGIPYNAADGTLTLPLWAAGVAAALVVVLFILALIRTGLAGTLVFLALLGFGGWAIWSWVEHERGIERRTLEARLSALEAQATMPGSALACLDGVGGETLETACERAVFANPETTASALSYAAARLSLLSDNAALAGGGDPVISSALARVRSALEQDRFGLVAHLLVSRQNCTVERCHAFSLFRDPDRIRAHMREKAFEAHLARAAPGWSARPVVGSGTPSDTLAAAPPPAPALRGTPLPPGYSLPSAASIPPVSIMAPEPAAGAPQADPPAQAASPPTPPRRPAAAQQQQSRPAAAQQQRPARPPRPRTNTADQPGLLPPPTRIQ
jgi:hypothetical protein